MNLANRVKVSGVWWKLFSIEFQTPDGKFSTYIYALDAEHASYRLEELKLTAVVFGEVAD
ncbi:MULTISPECIES: hypothetical protein [Pseudomonas]|uniref:Uncharacterized protein n=1 Tax=Pseudomonas cedrina TaxID=651740 RepID=A0A2S9E2D2_PSECE|nr:MULTISPECIES: hypothetical protein [Pseudomonas]AVJ20990.1 hypothetical protein CLM72_04255 [Pseudomonas sp. MYb193]PRC09013.1 hypothetical protein CQ006_04700 [Pseudomonas cedrina]